MLSKYTIKNSSINDLKLRINLGSNETFLGYQQEINNYIDEKSVDLINQTPDTEMRKFKYDSGNPSINNIMLSFNFTTSPLENTDITDNTLNVLNSFFIMETYDAFDETNNVKLSTNYLTKNLNYNNQYTLIQSNKIQFYYLFLPEYFIDQQTGTTGTTYVRFLFYNATSGKTSIFYNPYVSPDTDEYTYFNVTINYLNNSWKFTEATGILNINQIPEASSSFIQKTNDNISNFDVLKQIYPTGQTFNYLTQDYFTLSGITTSLS